MNGCLDLESGDIDSTNPNQNDFRAVPIVRPRRNEIDIGYGYRWLETRIAQRSR